MVNDMCLWVTHLLIKEINQNNHEWFYLNDTNALKYACTFITKRNMHPTENKIITVKIINIGTLSNQ